MLPVAGVQPDLVAFFTLMSTCVAIHVRLQYAACSSQLVQALMNRHSRDIRVENADIRVENAVVACCLTSSESVKFESVSAWLLLVLSVISVTINHISSDHQFTVGILQQPYLDQ